MKFATSVHLHGILRNEGPLGKRGSDYSWVEHGDQTLLTFHFPVFEGNVVTVDMYADGNLVKRDTFIAKMSEAGQPFMWSERDTKAFVHNPEFFARVM